MLTSRLTTGVLKTHEYKPDSTKSHFYGNTKFTGNMFELFRKSPNDRYPQKKILEQLEKAIFNTENSKNWRMPFSRRENGKLKIIDRRSSFYKRGRLQSFGIGNDKDKNRLLFRINKILLGKIFLFFLWSRV